eukprot:3858-Heterococcus_DN1.PRE.1
MSEARRQTDAGQNSSAVADALATAADDDTADCAAATKGSKGKKGKGKGKAGAPRKSAEESLTELALSCFEECVLIAAAGPPALCAKRVCKVLAAAHSSSSDSSSSSSSSGSSSSSSSQQLFHDHAVWLLKQLQPMLRDGDVKEAEVVVRTLATVVPLLLRTTATSGATTTEAALLGLDAFIDSLVQLCSSAKVTNPSLVRSLVALLLSARLENGSMRGDMLHIADVALQVRVAVGPISQDDESDEAEQQQPKRASQAVDLSIIVPATAEAAAEAVIAALEACTDAAELALAQLVKETTTHTAQQVAAAGAAALCSSSSSGAGGDSDDEAADSTAAALKCDSDVSDEDGDVEAKDPVDEREAFLSGRLRLLLSALDHLTQCALRGRAVDRVLSIISRCFRVLGRALKARISAKRYRVLRATERLLEYKKGFTEHVTMFIGYVNSPDCCEAAAGSATRSARRAKLIPELVYQVEQCDTLLLKLARLCTANGHPVEAQQWVARSTARDFTIKQNDVNKVQQQAKAKETAKKRKAESKASSNSTKKKRASSSDGDTSKTSSSKRKSSSKEPEVPQKKAKMGVKKKVKAAVEVVETEPEQPADDDDNDNDDANNSELDEHDAAAAGADAGDAASDAEQQQQQELDDDVTDDEIEVDDVAARAAVGYDSVEEQADAADDHDDDDDDDDTMQEE